MKTIIVATDFSVGATQAASYAADMALSIQADILLLHIFQIPVVYPEMPLAISKEEMMEDSTKSLTLLRNHLIAQTSGGINIRIKIVSGNFFSELEMVCKEIMPYAVVMGSQGSTAAERVLFGGHTIYAMKHLMWPLITVPPNAKFSQIKRISLACDYNEVIENTPLEELKRLVQDFNAELHVINSGKEEVYNPEMVYESGMLQELLLPLNPRYHFITDENAEESIINFVEQNQIDLLITLPKKRDLLGKLMHKSFSKRLILHSQVPVIAMHPSGY